MWNFRQCWLSLKTHHFHYETNNKIFTLRWLSEEGERWNAISPFAKLLFLPPILLVTLLSYWVFFVAHKCFSASRNIFLHSRFSSVEHLLIYISSVSSAKVAAEHEAEKGKITHFFLVYLCEPLSTRWGLTMSFSSLTSTPDESRLGDFFFSLDAAATCHSHSRESHYNSHTNTLYRSAWLNWCENHLIWQQVKNRMKKIHCCQFIDSSLSFAVAAAMEVTKIFECLLSSFRVSHEQQKKSWKKISEAETFQQRQWESLSWQSEHI